MKTPRTLLIEQAQTDDADEGTEWRDRMEAWLTCPVSEGELNDMLRAIYHNAPSNFGQFIYYATKL